MALMTEATGAGEKRQPTFLGHPLGLYVLFFSEMWERFSFYGMRALLILYMVTYFRWTQQQASGVYKWYTTLVYLTPLLGGFLADRYLGNKRAVIIGAILMAIGHFMMAFEELAIFYSALGFLIVGNGFFKPNMSTQVGRLYPTNDPRRDGAYTIFYMGINLGAFLSPLLCGWLAENSKWKFHAGFTAAGVGMVIGLFTYLFGLRWVKEIDPNSADSGGQTSGSPPMAKEAQGGTQSLDAATEKECEQIPSAQPLINRIAGTGLVAVGTVVAVAAPILWVLGVRNIFDFIFFELVAGCAFIAAWILTGTRNAVRDRVLIIYALAIPVVFFWGGFEQAGNVLNIWADQSTNRYIWTESSPPPLKPAEEQVQAEEWFARLFNPMPTAWFQSINALAIVVLAPFFAWLWTASERRGIRLTIPFKMATGLFFLSLSFAVMLGAARSEDQIATVQLASLPPGIVTNGEQQVCHRDAMGEAGEPFSAGRLHFDPTKKTLTVHGALPIVERDRILAETAPPEFVKEIKNLNAKASKAEGEQAVTEKLNQVPPGFDWSYTDFLDPKTDEVYCTFNSTDGTITVTRELAGKDILALEVAASDPNFRYAMNKLVEQSSTARVSWWWLFWAYIFATIGELCVSPVGLSMVSKLAPAKYATMLMGMWFLTTSFGQFVAGELGERYGIWTPTQYFLVFFFGTLVASLILFAVMKKIEAMTHGVR
jgi:proton-dependent oligopeptide transporter, POT family